MQIQLIKNPNEINDPPRPLMEHLLALRDMLVFAVVSWGISVILAAVCSRHILAWLKSPAGNDTQYIQGLDLMSGFSVMIAIAFWGGTIISFPFLTYALLRFIFPALTKREKVVLLTVLNVGTVLFVIGVFLAYSKTLPMVVAFLQQVNNWIGLPVTTIRIEGYISIVLKTILAFGLVFQLPLIIFVLGVFGLVTSAALSAKRRIMIVIAFVLAMFLTPPDPMSQILMAVPLCLLYELSIWAVWLKERFE